MEKVLNKYVDGYAKDKLKKKKLNNSMQSPRTNSTDISIPNISFSNIKENKFSSPLKSNRNDTINSVYNNTAGSGNKNILNNTFNNTMIDSNKKDFKYKNKLNNFEDSQNNKILPDLKPGKSLNKSMKKYIVTKELKEMRELEECTFIPKVNYHYPAKKNNNRNTENNSLNISGKILFLFNFFCN